MHISEVENRPSHIRFTRKVRVLHCTSRERGNGRRKAYKKRKGKIRKRKNKIKTKNKKKKKKTVAGEAERPGIPGALKRVVIVIVIVIGRRSRAFADHALIRLQPLFLTQSNVAYSLCPSLCVVLESQ
jgi:hypothetical protein